MKIILCDEKSCTQCYSCKQVCPKGCISFIKNNEGFSIPHINYDLCISCGLCVKSCHQLTPLKKNSTSEKVYAVWALNNQIRTTSSSGGLFSVLANYVLKNAGIVYGAAFDNDLNLKHIRVDNISELNRLKGSKYLQSGLDSIFSIVKKDLLLEKQVLFTGTPCQVAGLLKFLNKKYDNLITCDIICHGVPSQKAFDLYLKKIKYKKEGDSFKFRYLQGWGFELSYNNNIILPYKAFYLKAFVKNLMFSEACYSCKYTKKERIGDLTIGDFWGIGNYNTFNYSTKKGVSLLSVNSSIGNKLINKVSDELFFELRTLDEAVVENSNLTKQSTRPPLRKDFYEDLDQMPLKNLLSKYKLNPNYRDYLRILKRKLL